MTSSFPDRVPAVEKLSVNARIVELLVFVKGVDRGDLRGSQTEVEQVDVLSKAFFLGCFRNDGGATLHSPSKDHLSSGFLVFGSDVLDHLHI